MFTNYNQFTELHNVNNFVIFLMLRDDIFYNIVAQLQFSSSLVLTVMQV